MEFLKNPKEAVAYLNAHLEKESEGSEESFFLALRNVARAYGVEGLIDRTDLDRESLFRTFSTLKIILKTVGMKLTVEQIKKNAT